MEIFTKKLTPVDIQRGLVLPWDSKLEALPRFDGAWSIKLSTIVESAAGTTLAGGKPVIFHCCSTSSGKLAFRTGWLEIARDAGLKGGEIVSFRKEVNEGAEYKMRVRSVG